jgi:hypothetical protein
MRHSALRSELRWPAAALLAEIAAIHIVLVPAHLREAPYAGALFIALSAASLALAAVIIVSDHPMGWLAACGLAASAIFAYLVSRSVGLPMMSDDVGDWVNPLGVGALCAEAIAIALSLFVLMRRHGVAQPAGAPRRSPLATGSA